MENSYSNISAELLERPFSQRIKEGWNRFADGEKKLRQMIKEKAAPEKITQYCSGLLNGMFSDIAFEVGFNGDKFDLILSPEKSKFTLYFIDAIMKQAPETVLKHWNVIAGRRASKYTELGFDGQRLSPADVTVKITDKSDYSCVITGYSQQLADIFKNDENKAFWAFDLLLDISLNEITNMRYISSIDISEKPFTAEDNPLPLPKLNEKIKELFGGKEGWDSIESYLECYQGYRLSPDENKKDFLPREDVFVGFSSCLDLVSDYYNDNGSLEDMAEENGAAAGFFVFPLHPFKDKEKSRESEKILDFREELDRFIEDNAGQTAYRFLGGGTGIHFGYLDFIAWDLAAVLNAAKEFFKEKEFIPYAGFKCFKKDSGIIQIKPKKCE